MSVTILVVEDNPITRKLVLFALQAQHYNVIEAPDGATALACFRAQPISLVLLDLLLPDTDGFALLDKIRALPGATDVPILAFSGMLSSSDDARVSAVGFDDVVTKPIEPSRLIQIIRAHLPPAEPTPKASTSRTRTLVIADDDAVQRKLVALRLQRAGYKVTMTADGEEALARIKELKPDAIVSDVLMPRLDGFGLCMAVRNDPEIANIPILLVSNSYLDAEDLILARKAGADELIVRTPELRDVLAALSTDLVAARAARMPATPAVPAVFDPEIEHERIRRMMNQLERQVALHAGMSQRCSLLSAELSVLSGISEAVATQHDIESALHQVLASCFDAGGISLGMLYVSTDHGLRGMRFGPTDSWSDEEIDTFFGHYDVLDSATRSQTLVCIPSDAFPAEGSRELLARASARSLLIAPLGHQGQALGAMVTISRSLDEQSSDHMTFTQAVAGQISLALALARSFQAKDASERAAKSTATVLRSILESIAEGVVVSDEHGAITHYNPAATAILRVAPADLAATVLDRRDFPLTRAIHGESIDRAEIFVRHSETEDGSWLSVNARPLGDDAAGTRGGVAVFRDVTIEKAAHAQLMVSDRMASLGTLAAGVGHEINNPLMAVLGNLEMAVSDLGDLMRDHREINFGELPDELRDARDAAERVRNIVRDLKLFSRSDEETRGEVDIESVLESSIRMVWNEIRHRARLVRNFSPVPRVYANESRLGQVFLNLVVNAAQAIPEGRANQNEIRVATSVAPDGRVRIEITDTGSGMPPEVVARIFTPFFTTKPIGVGTGLGLAICHQLVSAVGGEISVDTKVGRGTTFAVLLPPIQGKVLHTTSATPVTSARRRGRVLVIDDEVMVATTIRRALASEHDVISLTDPHEAARRITSGERFDAILCDLMMPNATGMDLHADLARTVPEDAARVIFITGGAFTIQARTFLDTVTNQRLDKPIDLEVLRAIVNERVRLNDDPR